MKSLLMAVLLLVVAIVVYQETIGGSGKAAGQIDDRGHTSSRMIEQISP